MFSLGCQWNKKLVRMTQNILGVVWGAWFSEIDYRHIKIVKRVKIAIQNCKSKMWHSAECKISLRYSLSYLCEFYLASYHLWVHFFSFSLLIFLFFNILIWLCWVLVEAHRTFIVANTNFLVLARMHVKSLQSCLTLWDPMDCGLPGFSVRGILQERILEWVATPSFRGSSRPRDWTCVLTTPALASSFFTTSAAWEALGCGTWGLVLWPGIEPAPPALGVQPLSHWSARQAPCFFSFKGRWTSSNTWDQRHSQRSPLTAEDEDHPSALWSAPFRPLLLALEVMAGIWHLFKLPFCTHTSTEQIISTKKNYKTCNSRK